MGFLDRFKRNRKKSTLPTEVDEYYKSELRTRRGTSILFALFALIVTLVIAAGLFFGGRAIYRALNNDNQDTTKVEDNNSNSANTSPASSQDSSSSSGTGHGSSNSSSEAGGSTSTGSSSSDSSSSSSSSPSAPAPSVVPSTGDEPAALPHTGD